MENTVDSKSTGLWAVWVQIPYPLPFLCVRSLVGKALDF